MIRLISISETMHPVLFRLATCLFLVSGCSGDEGTETPIARAGTSGSLRASDPESERADSGLSAPSLAEAGTGQTEDHSDSGTNTLPSTTLPSAAPVAACEREGALRQIKGVIAVDVISTENQPMVLALLERPRSEPLDIEGNEPLPVLRAAYLIRFSSGEGIDGEVELVQIADDPGPLKDNFDRRAYERLADVHGACDGSGCIVALSVERITPQIQGMAYMTFLQLLDSDGDPQGSTRYLAREPDRGEGIETCLGVSNEGFLIATAVDQGRGRMLWLDRRGTPLDQSYIRGGFQRCSIVPHGLSLELVAENDQGILFHRMGVSSEPEGESGAWRPELNEKASHPVLSAIGSERILAFSDETGVHIATSSGTKITTVFDKPALDISTTPVGDGLLLAAVDREKNVSVILVDGENQQPLGRSTHIVKGATDVWAASAREKKSAWLGWLAEDTLNVQQVRCPASSASSPTKGSPLVTSDQLAAADRRAVERLRDQVRTASSKKQNYRTAWLLERVFHHTKSDYEAMVRAAGLLTEIRYSKSALRILERLNSLGGAEVRAALRTSCSNRDFERLWTSGDFQRITGCRAPAEPAPDAGTPEESDENEDEEHSPETPSPDPVSASEPSASTEE